MTDTPTEPPAPRRDERVALPTRAPLHLEATVRALQRRPSHPVERWDGARYRRALRTPDGLALVEVDNAGSVDAPDVRCAIVHGPRSVRARDAIVRTLRTRLGLDVDPAPLERLTGAEPRLAELAAALRGMRPPRFDDLFEACASVVPFQQVSLAAGVTVLGRLVVRFADPLDREGERYWAFPRADDVARCDAGALRACGLSAQRAQTLWSLAQAIASKELTAASLASCPSAEAAARLRQVKGIGPWSANLILLRGLGRLDVFPPGDVGVARGLGAIFADGSDADSASTEHAVARVVERFGDRRGYLYFYSLGADLLRRGLVHAASNEAAPTR